MDLLSSFCDYGEQTAEVNEWEVLAKEGIADEGSVDCPSFETIRIVYQ